MDRERLTKQIGMNIRKIRLQKDLSQESIALSAEIHPAYFGRLERGEKCPTISTLYKVAEALDVPIYALLDIRENSKPEKSRAMFRIEKEINSLPAHKQDELAEIIENIINFSC